MKNRKNWNEIWRIIFNRIILSFKRLSGVYRHELSEVVDGQVAGDPGVGVAAGRNHGRWQQLPIANGRETQIQYDAGSQSTCSKTAINETNKKKNKKKPQKTKEKRRQSTFSGLGMWYGSLDRIDGFDWTSFRPIGNNQRIFFNWFQQKI